MRHRLLPLVVLALAACSDQPTVPPDITVQVMEPVVWAGTDWVLRSPGFAALPTLPTVTLDDSTLAVTVVDDSTLTVRAPSAGGTHTLTLHTGTQILSGSVEVAGFLGVRTTIALSGWPLALEPGSPVMIAGAGTTLAQVNAGTGIATALPIPHYGNLLLSPGASFRANGVVATAYDDSTQSAFRPRIWALGASPMVVDSAPPSNAFQVVELSAGTWLMAAHHFYRIIKNGVASPDTPLEESERAVFSPDRSLVALTTDGGPAPPVLEAATGSVRYALPLEPVGAAAFTSGGDSLFVVGWDLSRPAGQRGRLATVASGTGQLLDDAQVPEGNWANIVLDPRGRWIYVTEYSTADVLVIDRHGMTPVVPLQVVGPCTGLPYGCDFGQVGTGVDPVQRRLHVLGALNWEFASLFDGNLTSPIADFSLPPVSQSPLTLVP